MRATPRNSGFNLYVWEGEDKLLERVARCMANFNAKVIRVDNHAPLPERDLRQPALALISASLLGEHAFESASNQWQAALDMFVIWVGSPSAMMGSPSHVLPLDFTCAQLRDLVAKLGMQPRAMQMIDSNPLIAQSKCMQTLLREVDTFADCDANVVICGATGVGKERIAHLMHEKHRSFCQGPFVAVNCGAIPDSLFESLFFGHTKGAFTSAVATHKGYFEQAEGGTLFLDEISSLPPYQQVKLLRVLEDKTVLRIGATTPTPVHFRLVAATNQSLPQLVQEGGFRADLYYRLSVIELMIPSLEERGAIDKIALFKTFIVATVGAERFATLPEIPSWLTDAIADAEFPGNVRELRNLAERIGITTRQLGRWDAEQVQRLLRREPLYGQQSLMTQAKVKGDPHERELILTALVLHAWRRQDTARYLGMSRKTLWEKMCKYQISDEKPVTLLPVTK